MESHRRPIGLEPTLLGLALLSGVASAQHTTRVSVDSAGVEGDSHSSTPAISADGQIVVFHSDATNLVSGDTNAETDIFVRDSCATVATWSNYGTGFPGTLGIPGLTAQAASVIGSTLDVDVGNSAGTTTLAILLVGIQDATIPLRNGGDLLVIPVIAIALNLPAGGMTLSEDLANDPTLCGLEVFAQALLVDPAAAKGQSASAGLKLVIGY
ncbi:MAG: hypothetical protein EXS13_12610 [Planctomycetes bacterium]|nr:hypothetical protein [Planctomycetota bacterium]